VEWGEKQKIGWRGGLKLASAKIRDERVVKIKGRVVQESGEKRARDRGEREDF